VCGELTLATTVARRSALAATLAIDSHQLRREPTELPLPLASTAATDIRARDDRIETENPADWRWHRYEKGREENGEKRRQEER
jgi:hypothetical protein